MVQLVRVVVLLVLAVISVAPPPTALGQGINRTAAKFIPDSSGPAETLLRNAANHAKAGQWAEAVGIYQRIIDQYGDKVASLPRDPAANPASDPGAEFQVFVDLRAFCHRSLALLPPEARAIYRGRIDPVAEGWFRDGSARRDVSTLRRIVDLAFCSTWGDDALELLGDIAFQDGRFGEALAAYRQIVPGREGAGYHLVYPDPSVDVARLAAKAILCRAAAGETLDVAAELAEYSGRYRDASGSLAGRKGAYATILKEALQADHLAPRSEPDGRWPTFAGSLRRQRVIPEAVDVGSQQWRVPLDRVSGGHAGNSYGNIRGMAASPQGPPGERLLAYHPIVLGDQVIVGDGTRVLAYNLNDRPAGRPGSAPTAIEPVWKHDPQTIIPQAYKNSTSIPRYTLTAVGNRIYARMGPATPSAFVPVGRGSGGASSYIIALDWKAQGKLLWIQRAADLALPNRGPTLPNRSVNFEGTPVADGRNVYLAVTDRREQTSTYVACFDAETGVRRWVRYLGAASPDTDNFMGMGMPFNPPPPSDFGHRLLSLEGPYLYYQTSLGAVVALEAETGSIRWIANYPRQDQTRSNGSDRDLNPAIVHDGLVFVAPSDASAIFAFHADNGRLAWKSDPIPDEVKVTHLLGVAKGRLVATGDRVLLLDSRTGKLVSTWPDSGKSEGYGRGLLAGDRIYWPTKDRIEVLDQSSGLRAEPPIRLMESYHTTGGNLVAGDGFLIIAQADALVVFCQNSRLIERYREELVRDPNQASTHYRLARAAEAVGRDQLALESYDLAVRHARASETVDGQPLAEVAVDHEYQLLIRLGEQERGAGAHGGAAASFEKASRLARGAADRLRARLSLAEVQFEGGHPDQAVSILGSVLADEPLRSLTVDSEDGHRAVRADLLIGDRLSAILKKCGRPIYEPYDKKAKELLEQGRRDQDARVLDEIAKAYPAALIVPESIFELAKLHESAGRPAQAARAYKRLLTLGTIPDADRGRALLRLARVFQAQNYLVAARDAYLDLQARHGRLRLPDVMPNLTLGEIAAAELASPALSQISAGQPRPPLPLPLSRTWHRESPDTQPLRVLTAAGVLPGLQSCRAFVLDGSRISPLDPSSGEGRWTVDLEASASWIGYLSDKLLAGNTQRVVAVDPTTGQEQWRFSQQPSSRGRRGPDPFAKPGPKPEAQAGATAASASLHGFQLSGHRLFCLRGDHELVALDGESGATEWVFRSPGGPINENLWIGTDRIVLQVQGPSQLLVLETESGRLVVHTPLADGEQLERPPVPIDEDHVLVVPDRRTVKKFDMSRGQFIWDYRESAEMPVNGPPRAMVDAERLLVLHDGRLLIRLDPVNGSRRWSITLGIEDLSGRPDAIACDDRRVYCVSRKSLRAFSIEDGTPLWSQQLSGPDNAAWSIALSARCVVAYPILAEDELRSLPVIVRRQDTGALVQRFVFPVAISDVKMRLDPGGALVSTNQALWALAGRDRIKAPRPDAPPDGSRR